MKLLPGVTYDLSQNILKYDKKFTSLKHHSLVLSISKIFKKSKQLKKWSKELNYQRVYGVENLIIPYKDWQKLGKDLEQELRIQLKSKSLPCEENLNKNYVQSTISFMGVQIMQFIIVKDLSSEIDVSDYVSNFVFTSQGTINLSKTVIQAAEKTVFKSELSKLRLMCYHFLEEKIKSIYAKSPNMLKQLQQDKEMEKHFSIYFWICEIIDPRSCISKTRINNINYTKWLDSKIEYSVIINKRKIFLEAVETNNEMAVEHLWINHKSEIGESALKTALTILVRNSVRINILMFLLLQEVNENEFFQFYKESSSIIKCVIEEVRWHCVFLKLFEVFKICFCKDKDFLEIFAFLADSCNQIYPEGMNLNTVIRCFSSLDKTFKTYLIQNSISQNHNPFGMIFVKAIVNNEKDFIEKLGLDDFTALKDFFKSECGMISLADACKEGNLSYIKKILKNLFEEGVIDFMGNFYNKKKEDLRRHFIRNCLSDKLKSFIEFFSYFENDVSKFKKETLYDLEGFLIKKTIFPSGEQYKSKNFSRAEEILEWGLPDEESIFKFKSYMDFFVGNDHGTNFFEEFKTCMLKSKFAYINELFQWKRVNQHEKNILFMKLLFGNGSFIKSIAGMTDFNDYLNNFTTFSEPHCAIEGFINYLSQEVHDERSI